jgi:DNA-binding transcriptional MerR regulator
MRTYTIGPVRTRAGISSTTYRQWERAKLIPTPTRSSDGRRQFSEQEAQHICNVARQRREEKRRPTASTDIDLEIGATMGPEPSG